MKFSVSTLKNMIVAARTAVESNLEYLNGLDSATGDGDHGTAILTAMRAAENSLANAASLKDSLSGISWAIMSEASGSTSSLNGMFYDGMSEAVTGEELEGDGLIAMFDSGLQKVSGGSRAKKGDKTLMDAMIPAVEAMNSLKGTGVSIADVLNAAAEAAQAGADSTIDLIAKHGRAKNLGERSKGHLDAGAVSLAMIFKAFADSVR